ncbi:MAG: hypothetical protein WDN08_06060 [Rhizomicrobium sp.]
MPLTLGGAALASVLLLAPSAFADDYYNTNPTAAERAQTERLNATAADRARGNADAAAANRADFNAATDRYDRERARTVAEQAAYDRDRARYDPRYPRPRPSLGCLLRLSRLPRRRHDEPARAQGPSRQRPRRQPDRHDPRCRCQRRPHHTRVAVSVGRGKTAWLDVDDLRFDPGTRVVYTTLSRDQVNTMARMRYPRF